MTAEEIKRLRTELGCSLGELAATIGVDTRAVLAWEAGDEFPTKRHVQRMQKLRAEGPGGLVRPGRPAPGTALDRLADPELWRIVRKLAAHPALFQEVSRLAERYEDPAKG